MTYSGIDDSLFFLGDFWAQVRFKVLLVDFDLRLQALDKSLLELYLGEVELTLQVCQLGL